MNPINHDRLLTVSASVFLIAGFVSSVPAKAAALDEGITISFTALPTQITWSLTGTDVNTGANGSLGSFKNACSILQGVPITKGNVMRRDVYVLDAGDSLSDAALYVYARTDVITAGEGGVRNDAVTVALAHTLHLGLSGATDTSCYMAANETAIFAGNSANLQANIIYKDILVFEPISSPGGSSAVSAITASGTGIVYVMWGTGPGSFWKEYDGATYLASGLEFNFTVVAGATNATSISAP